MEDIVIDKKAAVETILNEIKKVITKAIDDGRATGYTPLDLICMVVQEIAQMAIEMQEMDKAFDENDSDEGKGKA
jgi:hypothetical protein